MTAEQRHHAAACNPAGSHFLRQLAGLKITQSSQGVDHRTSVTHQRGSTCVGPVFTLTRKVQNHDAGQDAEQDFKDDAADPIADARAAR